MYTGRFTDVDNVQRGTGHWEEHTCCNRDTWVDANRKVRTHVHIYWQRWPDVHQYGHTCDTDIENYIHMDIHRYRQKRIDTHIQIPTDAFVQEVHLYTRAGTRPLLHTDTQTHVDT